MKGTPQFEAARDRPVLRETTARDSFLSRAAASAGILPRRPRSPPGARACFLSDSDPPLPATGLQHTRRRLRLQGRRARENQK